MPISPEVSRELDLARARMTERQEFLRRERESMTAEQERLALLEAGARAHGSHDFADPPTVLQGNGDRGSFTKPRLQCVHCRIPLTSDGARAACPGDRHVCQRAVAEAASSTAFQQYGSPGWLCGQPGSFNAGRSAWTCAVGHRTDQLCPRRPGWADSDCLPECPCRDLSREPAMDPREAGIPAPRVTRAGSTAVELPGSDLFEEVRRKLVDDLGMVQVERRGQERIYRPRAELLAEAVTPETFVMVMDWLSSTRRGSLQTKRNYVDDIRRVWGAYAQELGHERFTLGCFTPDHIRAWRLRMEGRDAPPTTISRYLNALSSLHTYAAEKIDLPRNPVTQDDRPKVDKGNTSRSTPVLEVEEIQAVAAAAENEFDALVVLLLYTLAGRVTEMVAADVDKRIDRGRRSYLDVTRKEHKERILPLPVTVAELLDAHTAGRTEGPLLLDADGRRLDRHDVARLLTRLGRKARVLTCSQVDGPEKHTFTKCKICRRLTPHVLRASRITHMLDAHVDLAEVQAFADHDNPATTVGYWNRRNKGQRNAAHVDAAEELFTGITDRFRLDD